MSKLVKLRKVLVCGVCASALMVGTSNLDTVFAEDRTNWQLHFEGRGLFYDGAEQPWTETRPLGAREYISPDFEYGGKIGVTATPLGSPMDYSLFVSYGRSTNKDSVGIPNFNILAPYYIDYSRASAEHVEEHATIDFEVGRDAGLGSLGISDAKARYKLGLRFAHFSATTKTDAYYNGGPAGAYNLQEEKSVEFNGLGPRIGIETKQDLGQGWSTSLDLNASFLFGEKTTKTSWSNDTGCCDLAGGSTSRSENTIIPILDGAVGLTHMLPNNLSLTIGYRGEAWLGVMDVSQGSSNFGNSLGSRDADRIVHGPFVRLSVILE